MRKSCTVERKNDAKKTIAYKNRQRYSRERALQNLGLLVEAHESRRSSKQDLGVSRETNAPRGTDIPVALTSNFE